MNVKRVIANLVVHLKQFSREKSTIFFVLAFPILLMLLFGFIFSDVGSSVGTLYIQDLDGGAYSQGLVGAFNGTGVFDVTMVDTNISPDQYYADNNIDILLVIPAGYSDSIYMKLLDPASPEANLTILYDQSNTNTQTKISIVGSVIDGMNKELSGSVNYIGVDLQGQQSDEFKFIDFFAPGIIAMSVMSSSLFGTVGMNTELRQKGILRKLATTPLTRAEWLLSNILYQMFMSLLSTVCILAVGMGMFGLRPHINIYMFVFILLCVFSFAGIGMLITRFVKEAESAQAAANAVMFPMMFLSGTFFQLEMMPDFLQTLARFLPLYYVNEGLRAAMISLDYSIILESALVIGTFGTVVFMLGVMLTSWKEN
ncbi:MAG: ABC transporter permease [Candidatus Thermoplasmatota archaeon]|nr:ABC transporter permease [Euryarchaeota archaeon]MBU4031282.1 ABC transporter permease [Candidatus Thermoplasmatota archaeon]MBU4071372.1 ABC transporter permease [Candidatus Thermoplasmatota archaeon]MBU4144917.1 ABC transporter permease [Candidatus Thermoplasmatota archaeon]MBU4591505.1 ABC transporter permease [Candidatus Thermoplasmatota archaeon]